MARPIFADFKEACAAVHCAMSPVEAKLLGQYSHGQTAHVAKSCVTSQEDMALAQVNATGRMQGVRCAQTVFHAYRCSQFDDIAAEFHPLQVRAIEERVEVGQGLKVVFARGAHTAFEPGQARDRDIEIGMLPDQSCEFTAHATGARLLAFDQVNKGAGVKKDNHGQALRSLRKARSRADLGLPARAA